MIEAARKKPRSQFQSAPLTEARGDLRPRADEANPYPVSIRSPHRSKGRLARRRRTQGFGLVSIRSPHRSKGRPARCSLPARLPTFQSAPLTEARGDAPIATQALMAQNVSIRSPHRSKGRQSNVVDLLKVILVSIRSPHRSKGRRLPQFAPEAETTFQSAPLTEARGDAGAATRSAPGVRFNPLPSPKQGETTLSAHTGFPSNVSIRSPHRSKGRLQKPGQGFTDKRFQSAPLTEARGDRAQREDRSQCRSFNPLPSPKQGETYSGGPPDIVGVVSIRSPHRSKGRQKLRGMEFERPGFQSAPLTEARGD